MHKFLWRRLSLTLQGLSPHLEMLSSLHGPTRSRSGELLNRWESVLWGLGQMFERAWETLFRPCLIQVSRKTVSFPVFGDLSSLFYEHLPLLWPLYLFKVTLYSYFCSYGFLCT
jgi:hypothetical protein